MGSGYANRSSSASIPGTLGLREYALLAEIHKPRDHGALTVEITRLRGTGLSIEDIAMACRVSSDAVRQPGAARGAVVSLAQPMAEFAGRPAQRQPNEASELMRQLLATERRLSEHRGAVRILEGEARKLRLRLEALRAQP